jgi:leucyl aminopeptidase
MRLSLTASPLPSVSADWLVLPVWEEGLGEAAQEADRHLNGRLARLGQTNDLTGKPNELMPLYEVGGLAASRLLAVGLGKRDQLARHKLIKSGFAASKFICGKKRALVAAALPDAAKDLSLSDVLLNFAAGLLQGCHGPGIRQSEPGRFAPEELLIVAPELSKELEAAVKRAEIEGRAVLLARELVNMPPGEKHPEAFSRRIQDLARTASVGCTILDENQIRQERMGCLLGVSQGSSRPPRLAVLEYRNGGNKPMLGFVGKGVTFDSGGLSLKTNEQMLDMKCDMAGAAAVIAAVQAIAELKLPVNVLAVTPLVENLPSGTAIKLGDVLTARNGKTVEVLNTDAEGRLILADALSYAVDRGVAHIVDLATLTGACMVALGTDVAGLLSNHPQWAGQVQAAADRAGERTWPLPMFAEYGELLKSQVADIKNVGGKYGGAILGAKFLENFVGATPWVHLDIAGPAFVSEDSPSRDAGGTGCFVRSLVELAATYGAV